MQSLRSPTLHPVGVAASFSWAESRDSESGGSDVSASEEPYRLETDFAESGVIGFRRTDDFALFFGTHRRSIERFVRRAVGEGSEVDDICADVFVVALRRFEEIANLPDSAARSWLFRVAELRGLEHQRSRCRRDRAYGRAAATFVPNERPVDDEYMRFDRRVELSNRVHVVLALLQPSHREVLRIYMDADGQTGRQLAEALGVTHLVVRVRLTRAKRAFRAEYGRHFGDCDQPAS